MKRICYFLLIMLCIICLFSCGGQSKSVESSPVPTDENGDNPSPESDASDALIASFKNDSANKLTVSDLHSHFPAPRNTDHKSLLQFSSVTPNLHVYASSVSIIELQKIDATHVFAVSELEEEGISPLYVYVMFVYDADIQTNSENAKWIPAYQHFFVNDLNAKEAYASVKIGDSAQDLCNIDPSVNCDLKFAKLNPSSYKDAFYTYRILKDGVLCVKCEKGSDDINELSSYSITDIQYVGYADITESEPLVWDALLFSAYQAIKLPASN